MMMAADKIEKSQSISLDFSYTFGKIFSFVSRVAVKTRAGAEGVFTKAMCAKLRVPCRFVTEHPCCKLPQDIGLLAR